MRMKKAYRQLISALVIAIAAATVHGVWFAPTAALNVAPVAGIRLSTWDPYLERWSVYFIEEHLNDAVLNPEGTIRHSEGAIIELRPVSGAMSIDFVPPALGFTVIPDISALGIAGPGDTPEDDNGQPLPHQTASGTPIYIQLNESSVATSTVVPPDHVGPWAGPIDPTDDDLSAVDFGGSVGVHNGVQMTATGDTVTFTWDVGRWAKGDIFLGLNNHTYKVLDRHGNFKRFVAVADLEDPDYAIDESAEWYSLTTGCATNWKSGEMWATNFGEGMPAVNVIARHPDGIGRALYSPLDRRVSTRIERPDFPVTDDFGVPGRSAWWGIDNNPESVAFDGNMNMYVGNSFGNRDDRPTAFDQQYWADLDYDMFNDSAWYPMALDGLPAEWSGTGSGYLVDETGAQIKMALPGSPINQYVPRIVGVEVSPRMEYEADGVTLRFGPAPPAISGLDMPSLLPLGYVAHQTLGTPLQRLDANDVPVPGLVPHRWNLGKRLHRYNLQPDGTYAGSENLTPDRDVFWTFTGRQGTDWIDVNATGDVLYYTSEDSFIHRYRVNVDPLVDEPIGQLPDLGFGRIFAPGSEERRFNGLRILPPGDGTGGFLVASTGGIHRLRGDGTWVQSYQISNDYYKLGQFGPSGADVKGWYAIEVDPGGRKLWAAPTDSGWVYVFDIATGNELWRFEAVKYEPITATSGGREVQSMCIMWEYTAAQEICGNGIDDDGDGFIDENCKAIEVCSALSPGDDNGDGLADANDPDCGADLPPVAVNDFFETVQDTQLNVPVGAFNQVLNNDFDPDNEDVSNPARHDILTVAFVATSGTPSVPAGTQIPTAQGGRVTLNEDGSMVYVPPFFFHGIDTFVYNITDAVIPFEGQNYSNTATVTIIVRPLVAGDTYTTDQGVTLDTDTLPADKQMLFNDPSDGLHVSAAGPWGITYLNGNPSITFITENGGTVEVFRSGRFIYTPLPTFIGQDYFKYRGNDDVSDSVNDAVVVITVNPVSTIVVTTDPDPSVYGNPADVIATVTCGLNMSPSVGTVTFRQGTTVLAANVPVVNGVARTTLPANLAVGLYEVEAVYSGNDGPGATAPICPGNSDTDPHEVIPRPAVVTADPQTKPYGTVFSFAGTEFTTEGFIFDDHVTSATLVSATGSPATATVLGSTYPIVPSHAVGVGLSNYTITYVNGPLTVTPVPLIITALDKSKVYGDVVSFDAPEQGPDYTVAGLVNGEVITGATLASAGGPATATVPGSPYEISIADAVGTDFTNYVVTYVPGTLTVTPRPLTVTAHDKTKVVDEPLPELDGVWAGFINGDTVDNIYTTTAVQSSPVGSYPITPEPDLDDPVLLNYVLTIIPGTLTITPKSIDVLAQPVCIADTPYVNFTITATNFTPTAGEDIVVRWKDSTGAVVATQTFIWTDVSAPFSQQVLWPGAVVDDQGKVIDWPGWIFDGTTWVEGNDGFQLTRPTATVEIEVNPTAALQVSYPPPTPMCDAAPPKTPTIVATGGVYPYDTLPHAATCTVTGANGESLPGVLTYDNFGDEPPVNAGTYPATCTFAGNDDYVPLSATAIVTITPVPLVITADDKSKVYDKQVYPGPYTVTYEGFVGDEDPGVLGGALSFSGAALPAVNVGTYTGGIVPGGYTSSNYVITYVPGTLRIEPPVLIITADDKTKPYDGTVYSPFTVTYDGFVGDDDPSVLDGALAFSGAASTAVNVGTYTDGIVPGGYTSTNYTISYVPGTLTITPVPLVITADDKTKAYDGTPYSPFTVTYNGFVGDDDPSDLGGALAFSGAAVPAVNVGTYADGIVPGGYTSTNYIISYVPGTLTITPIPVTVKAHDKTIYVGDPLPTLDGVWTGFLPGESATAVYTTTGSSTSPVGTYPITPTPDDSPVLSNYIVTIIPGTLTILPRDTACTATGYVTYSQGGWGSPASGNSPGALLVNNFSAVYTGGSVQIGGTHTLTFTSAAAVRAYLPAGGSAQVLTSSATNPTSSRGVLSAQLLALQLAVDFSNAGVLQSGLGSMVMVSGPLAGQSVDDILDMANAVFGGNTSALPSGMSLSGLASALESIIMNYHEGADGGLLTCGDGGPPVCVVVPPSPGLALVRRDSTFDGRLEGSIQLMQAVNVTMNSTAVITQQLLLPGVPSKTFNGGTSVNVQNGTGAATPTSHHFMFNSGATLGSLVQRTDAVALPTVATPPSSAGTRNVTMNNASDSVGAFSTLRDLTLNSNVGPVAIPAGTYRTFIANHNTAFVLGVAGATQPAVYNFETLTLNSGSRLDVVGPVVITVKNSVAANGPINSSEKPEWLTFRVSNGDFTLNSNVPFYGYAEVPNNRITVNNGAKLIGGLAADRLTINSGGLVRLVGDPGDDCGGEEPEPLALVVKIDDKVKIYGDPDPALTYQVIEGGPVGPGVLSGTIARVPGEPVGDYVIGAGTLSAASNYTLTVIPGTLTVLPRPAVVTAGTGTKVYGTVDPALTAVTTTGFLSADLPAITLAQSRATGQTVGSYPTTATATGAVLGNYTVTYVGAVFTITPAPLTIVANDKTKVQGQPNPTLDGTISGVVNGDVITAAYATTATTSSPVGAYPISPSAVDPNGRLSNYLLSLVPGTLTITAPAPVCTVGGTVTLNQSSGSTGTAGNVRTFSGSGVGVKAAAYSRLKTSNSWATAFLGAFTSYGLGVTDSGESGSNSTHAVDNDGRNNYIVFVFNQPVAMSQVHLGWVSGDSDAEFWFGTIANAYASMPSLNDAVLASLGAAEVNTGGSSARWAQINATRRVGNVLVVAARTTESNDYFKVAGLKFDPVCEEPPPSLTLVVKIDDKVKTYGDADPALTYQVIEGGPVSPGVLSGAIARVSGESVGQYVIGRGTLAAPADYTLTVIPGTLTVLPRPAVVTAGTGTKVYGSVDPALTAVTTTGFLSADLPAITLAQSRATGQTVGNYPTTATATGAVLSNYTVTYIGGTFTITPAPLTITANNKTKVQGQPNPTLDGTISGVVNGDVITAAYATTATTSSPVGTYPITPSAVDPNGRLSNYIVSLVPGTLTVTAPTQACAFRTQTQGGWGTSPSGSNPGAFLQAHFASLGGNVVIGTGSKTLTFTSAAAVRAFLPAGGSAKALNGSATNPTKSSAGVFAGQVLALRISVGFSNAGVTQQGLGALTVKSGALAGKTVAEVLDLANRALGGQSVGYSISTLNTVVDAINNNFVDGTTNKGYLNTGSCN